MAPFGDGEVDRRLGVRQFINALGHGTAKGGRNLAVVQEAVKSAGLLYVETTELQAAAGRRIAELLDVEAAFPTSGCAAAGEVFL